MSIKETIGAMTQEALARWTSDASQFDEWYGALLPHGPVAIGRVGLAVVSVGMGGSPAVEIHGHDTEDIAHGCFRSGVELVSKYAIATAQGSVDVPSADDQPTVELDRSALPVSTDEPTARTFGWL